MGIYVQGYGTIPASERHRIAEHLVDSARSWASGRGVSELFYGVTTDAGAWLSIYPPGGEIVFEIDSGGIGFGTKTSIAGPGFHAALVDLCDHLQSDLGITWRWEGGGDETNYAVRRDFGELQEAFLDQVLAHCEFLHENQADGERHAINLTEGWAIDGYDGVATPLGPVPAQRFLDVLNAPADAEHLARRIYPWWGVETDQQFWIGTLRAMLWTEAEWRAARTPWETHVHEVALSIGERLRDVLNTPLRRAVEELAARSQDVDDFVRPSPEGIGYLRRRRAFFLTGHWRINLPGYYIEQIEDEGSTVCLWFGNEEIRTSSFRFDPAQGNGGRYYTWSDALATAPDRDGKGHTYRIEPVPRPSDGNAGYFQMSAEFQTRDADGTVQLLLLSLFSSEGDLTARMSQIAEGVYFDRPRPGDGNRGH